jgi:hypothetical protein
MLHSVQENALVLIFFIVNITGYCPMHGKVAGHMTFTTLVSHMQKVRNGLAFVKHLSVSGAPFTLQHVIKQFLAATLHKYLLIVQNKNIVSGYQTFVSTPKMSYV